MNGGRTVELPLLTHSSMSAFKRCRRLYYYRYVKGVRPQVDAHALRFGSAMHEAIDRWHNGEEPSDTLAWLRMLDLSDPYSARTAAALFWAYAARYESCRIVESVQHSEQSFAIPLTNPETHEASDTFQLAGKMDAIVTTTAGEVALKETKTTGEAIDDNRYWRRLLIDPQVSLYWLAAERLGHPITTIVYDVIRKPAMRPYKATPIESRKYKKDGELYANQREHDETPDEWEARVYADATERPDYYFARREIPRLDADLDAFRQETWDVAQDIAEAERTDRWYRNPSRFNCDDCCYFGLCTGMEIWDGVMPPPGLVVVGDLHPELEREIVR